MPTPSAATLDLLERLVALDSTSATHSNVPVIDACAEVLAGIGAHVERIEAEPHPFPGGDLPKQGLLARVGPDVDGGVVLSGHTDCVPTEGQPWTTDPLVLTERDGRLLGRGTTDMKGFIAAALAVGAPAAAAADLARPLWVLLTWDEELGTIGAGPMTDALVARTRPSACIVGEPTSMRPAAAHKGVRSFTVTVRGSEGHSSKPHLFANALVGASRIVCRVDDVATRLREAGGAPAFDPPYTTMTATLLRSGTAVNIIPREAELLFEYRPVPADDGWDLGDEVLTWADEHVLPTLRAVAPDAAITCRRGPVVRPLSADGDPAADALVRRLTGHDGPTGTVPFGTDGGWHQAAGVPTVVCGPGDIDQAHQPDEFIDPGQLAACETMLEALARDLQTPH